MSALLANKLATRSLELVKELHARQQREQGYQDRMNRVAIDHDASESYKLGWIERRLDELAALAVQL